MNYYNEHDNFAADWLENLIESELIPNGKVDRRSITEVQADDVRGFTQCHFFAGIGGWSLALRLAGWSPDRPVWTGSCPCQPFSQAGKQKAQKDERHLWPQMFRLIRECSPVAVFGEQVASAIGHGWLDGISTDLEGQDYAIGSVVLGAFSVGAPHKRSRLFWVANPAVVQNERSRDAGIKTGQGVGRDQPAAGRYVGSVGHSDINRRRTRVATSQGNRHGNPIESASRVDSVGHAGKSGLERRNTIRREHEWATWSSSVVIKCIDGKSRRVGCGVQPLVNGIHRELGRGKPELSRLAKRARANRIGRLKGYGNAIVPQVAAEFVMAFMDCE